MAGKGGKRPGAGRPPNSKRVLSKEIAAKILGDAHFEKIFLGLLKSKSEKIKLETLKYLCDHTWGKAQQPLVGDGGGPVEIKVVYEE